MIDTHGWERVFMDFWCLGRNQDQWSTCSSLFSVILSTPWNQFYPALEKGKLTPPWPPCKGRHWTRHFHDLPHPPSIVCHEHRLLRNMKRTRLWARIVLVTQFEEGRFGGKLESTSTPTHLCWKLSLAKCERWAFWPALEILLSHSTTLSTCMAVRTAHRHLHLQLQAPARV